MVVISGIYDGRTRSICPAETVKLGHIESSKLIAAMPEMAAAQKQLETKQDDIQRKVKT